MKITISRLLVLLLFIAAATVLLAHYISKGIKEEKASYEVNIGKTIVIGGDTLMIVDYNSIFETYKLSNGTEVNKAIVK